MNNTQPERTTDQVIYRVLYFEAYDNVFNSIKERFHQPDFEIYKHIQNIFINVVNQKCCEDSLNILKEILIGRTYSLVRSVFPLLTQK